MTPQKRWVYRPKSTVYGYKIGLKNTSRYIGIPVKYFSSGSVQVLFNNRLVNYYSDDVVGKEKFDDKFRPGKTYTLAYVPWEDR